MSALNRKLFRDLLQMKGQALAISLVIACGVAMLVMSINTLRSLVRMKDVYYERYRFAEVFAGLKRAPNSLIPKLEKIPGVARAQTRVVLDVTIDVEGLAEPATGRLISVPDNREPVLNHIHLRKGRWIDPERRGEVMASEVFAAAHGFEPGDSIEAIINGRRQKLTIVGVALSPEYVFQIRPGDFLPDDRRFGVFWMGYRQLASAYNMEGGFNDITLSLMPGASEPEALRRLDDVIEPYGGLGSHGRNQHVSHRFLSDDIQGLKGMGTITPAIFLGIAAFLLNVVLTRMIATQREQIAALKAFGYTHWEVGIHYLKLVSLIVIFGTALGIAVGVRLGQGMTNMYTQFYRFPLFLYRWDVDVMALAFLIAAGSGFLGTLTALHRAVKLPPAEAMRPEPPAAFRATLLERLGLQRLLTQTARMILRQLERKPLKAALSCIGVAMAAAILVVGNFSGDAFGHMIDFQFSVTQRQDMSVAFVEPRDSRALREVERLPGVIRAEAFRSVPARLRAGHHFRRLGITGIPAGADLQRLMDADSKEFQLPPEGIVLSDKLARILEVKPGDIVRAEMLEGTRTTADLTVAGVIQEYSSLSAYMDIEALNRFAHEGPNISGAHLLVDSSQTNRLYQTIKATPGMAGVTLKDAAVRSFMDTIAESMLQMKAFNVMFACVIAFGIVYNTARISLSERSRELATLRVVGFTRAEISAILLGELAVITLIAIPLGLLIGYGLAASMVQALDTELYRIPLIVYRSTYAMAATIVMASAIVSGLIVRRRLDHLDLIAVLKTKE